jgi:chromosome segregation ATPase
MSTAAEVNAQRIGDGPASIAAAAAVPADLDARIEAAFSDGAASAAEVAALIREIEAIAPRLDVASEEAFAVVSSEVRSIQEIREARRLIEDVSARRRHLQTATADLRERLKEVRAQEEDQQRWVTYDRVKAERDKVAAELARAYPDIEEKLRELLAPLAALLPRLEESDRRVRHVNARLPSDADPLREAELVARKLRGFFDGDRRVPSITDDLQVPTFRYSARAPFVWPPSD